MNDDTKNSCPCENAGQEERRLLEQISTWELVKELSEREGVTHRWIEPYKDVAISVSGPARRAV